MEILLLPLFCCKEKTTKKKKDIENFGDNKA
jgi:hypothetical protein